MISKAITLPSMTTLIEVGDIKMGVFYANNRQATG